MITRANYEVYFLDYYEGVLDAGTKEELFAFLDMHPDLRVEFENFAEIKIEPDSEIVFSGKSKLHRSNINERNYISKLIASLEGDLDEQAKKELEEYINSRPGVAEELEILKRTKLRPDHSIKFNNKSALKKEPKLIVLRTAVYRTTAIAASLILLLLSYSIFNKSGDSVQLAQQNSTTESPVLKPASNPEEVVSTESLQSGRTQLTSKVDLPSNNIVNKKPGDKAKVNVEQSSVLENQSPSDQASVNPELPEEKFDLAQIDLPVKENDLEVQSADPAMNDQTVANTIESENSVFTLDELQEFEQMKTAQNNTENANVWNLASAGVEKLSKITGTKMELDRHHDHIANATTYALEVGSFSISRTNVK